MVPKHGGHSQPVRHTRLPGEHVSKEQQMTEPDNDHLNIHPQYCSWVDEVIKAETANTPHRELVIQICPTPALLTQHGCPDLPLLLKAKTVGKIFFEHGMTKTQIEQLPVMLHVPRALYRSASHTDSVVVLTFEENLGAPIIVPIAKNRMVGRARVNEIVSAYAKTGPDQTPRWRAQGLLLWEHK